MDRTRRQVLIGAVVGFLLPLGWWAVPGGREPGSFGRALLLGLAIAALLAGWNLVRARTREGAVQAGRELRRRRGLD
jgi:hypothetical protein